MGLIFFLLITKYFKLFPDPTELVTIPIVWLIKIVSLTKLL